MTLSHSSRQSGHFGAIIDTALPEYSVTIIDRQVAIFHAGTITNAGVQQEGKCQSCSWRKQQAVSVPPCTHSLDALHICVCVYDLTTLPCFLSLHGTGASCLSTNTDTYMHMHMHM